MTFSSKRHPALIFRLSLILSEKRLPLFRIMLGPRPAPHLARRQAVKILERVAEVGWVLEAAAEGDFFDLHVPFPKVGQITIRAREPHAAHMIAHGLAG